VISWLREGRNTLEIDPFTIDKKAVSAPADIKVMIDFLTTTEVNTQNLGKLAN
jgi:hypothetical protein